MFGLGRKFLQITYPKHAKTTILRKVIIIKMEQLILAIYMLCSLLFIMSLGSLSKQETASKGNYYGMIAMALAIGVSLATPDFGNEHFKFWPVFLLGGLIGLLAAL